MVARLREQRQLSILAALLMDDACGAPGCMLAQRLVQLAEAASALPANEAGMMLLCPPRRAAAAAAAATGCCISRRRGSNACGWFRRR
jgi:hypothetical protein